MTEPKDITFEDGYRRLQEIAEQVNEAEVPVDRMGDLFAEGKGLDKALTDHLAEQKTRIERIERGEEIHAFRIVAPDDAASASDGPESDTPASDFDQVGTAASTDDIPF
jgi:exodeoxyribonuclease VII small subunit